MQSQLVTTFHNAVDAFNNCQHKGDYRAKVRSFLHDQVIMDEFDPPNTLHIGSDDSVDYLDNYQWTYLPRFHPDYDHLFETPSNSDQAVYAWLAGPGVYYDKSTDAKGIPCWYFFQFRRNTAGDDWLISIGSARSITATHES